MVLTQQLKRMVAGFFPGCRLICDMCLASGIPAMTFGDMKESALWNQITGAITDNMDQSYWKVVPGYRRSRILLDCSAACISHTCALLLVPCGAVRKIRYAFDPFGYIERHPGFCDHRMAILWRLAFVSCFNFGCTVYVPVCMADKTSYLGGSAWPGLALQTTRCSTASPSWLSSGRDLSAKI